MNTRVKVIVTNLLEGSQHTTFPLLFTVIFFSKISSYSENKCRILRAKKLLMEIFNVLKILYRNKSLLATICVTRLYTMYIYISK